MDVNLLFGPGFKQAGSPLMEMKLIFSLIETGALPASFLGITNLSFLFYPPPDANLRYSKGFCVVSSYVHRVESHEFILFHGNNYEAFVVLKITSVDKVLADFDEPADVFGNVVDAGPLVGRNAQ